MSDVKKGQWSVLSKNLRLIKSHLVGLIGVRMCPSPKTGQEVVVSPIPVT